MIHSPELTAARALVAARARAARVAPDENPSWIHQDPLIGFLGAARVKNPRGLSLQKQAHLALLEAWTQRVCDALTAARIACLPVKGVALVGMYRETELRPITDIDLLVPLQHFTQAVSVLRALDFSLWEHTAGGTAWLETEELVSVAASVPGEITLVQPTGMMLDLHWHILPDVWLRRARRIDMAEIWEAAVPSPRFPGALQMSGAHTMAYSALNLGRNAFASFHGYIDLHLLCERQNSSDDWQSFVAVCRDWQIRAVAHRALLILREFCGTEVPAPVLDDLRPAPGLRVLQALWVRPQRLLKWPRRAITDRYIWLTQLIFLDRPRDFLSLVWQMLFPDRSWLRLRYGRGDLRTHWRNLLRIVRFERPHR